MRIARSHTVLKLQSGLADSVRQGLDSAVVKEAAAMEADSGHAGGLRLVGDRLPDLRGLVHAVAFGLQLNGRRGSQRVAVRVVDELHIEMVEAAEHGQPRPFL